MSEFRKYHHIERFGQEEVEDIHIGECHIFPKLDGTNSSIWWCENSIDPMPAAGSRNRDLTLDNDNAGFYEWVLNQPNLWQFLKDNPKWRLYGEWLIPHTLKTYREDAWRRFWIFDVCVEDKLIHYDEYYPVMQKYNLDVIEPLCIVKNGTDKTFQRAMDQNTYLIEDGKGVGEGIVIKNYHWENKFGHQVWAKLVRNEFKEDNRKQFGLSILTGKKQIESEIAELFVTKFFVDKIRAKIELETKNRKIVIPRLLQTCFHDIVKEEIWDIVKKYRNPTINFGMLQKHVIYKVKQYSKDLF